MIKNNTEMLKLQKEEIKDKDKEKEPEVLKKRYFGFVKMKHHVKRLINGKFNYYEELLEKRFREVENKQENS
ncbi:hypothetical protein V1477_008613 [Vespula maculifrons]|uniref:Uncharacterized protein n=1 Tax=Vespula maculifrons TaxID=7453 RepID=A0ABD2CDI3_VESMC